MTDLRRYIISNRFIKKQLIKIMRFKELKKYKEKGKIYKTNNQLKYNKISLINQKMKIKYFRIN